MAFTLRSYRRFRVQCSVTYNTDPFQGRGTVWNLSKTGWRLSGDLPMRPGRTLLLIVTLPNEQHIKVPEAVVRWSREHEFGVKNVEIEPDIQARLQHYVKRLVQHQGGSERSYDPMIGVHASNAVEWTGVRGLGVPWGRQEGASDDLHRYHDACLG